MPELYRLEGTHRHGKLTLVLTHKDLIVDPSPEFRRHLQEAFQKGREGAAKAPGAIAWFVDKVLTFADNYVEKALAPHPLPEANLSLVDDKLTVSFGYVNFRLDEVKVDPTEAFAFDMKFQQAKAELKGYTK